MIVQFQDMCIFGDDPYAPLMSFYGMFKREMSRITLHYITIKKSEVQHIGSVQEVSSIRDNNLAYCDVYAHHYPFFLQLILSYFVISLESQ